MELTGEKLYLREIAVTDTEDIVRWRNRDEVRAFFINRDLFTIESHTAWLNTVVAQGKAAQFIIVDKSKDYAFGSVYLRDIDYGYKKAEFGIFIGEEQYRGAGYGSEAIRLILEYGFEHLQLNKISLRVLADNPRAIKAYENAGFVREGYLRQEHFIENKYVDIILMAILRDEYMK